MQGGRPNSRGDPCMEQIDNMEQMVPRSHLIPVFYNRVGWARIYLKKAGLIKDPKRGYFQITERGKDVLKGNPDHIDMQFLRQFPEYVEFRKITKEPGPSGGILIT